MRTTVTLEDDVATELERIVFETRKSFKSVINDLLKRALRDRKKAALDVPFFLPAHHSGGLVDGLAWSDIKKIDQEQEEDYFMQKLRDNR